MDPRRTEKLPRNVIASFIGPKRGVTAFEDLQVDTVNAYEALTNASFLTVAGEPSLGSERVFTLGAGLTATDGGPGGNYTLGLANSGVVAGTYGSASQFVSITFDAKGRATGASSITASTSNILEGSNLYFTTARARSALSSGTGIDYNNTTGVIALDSGFVTSGSYTPTLSILANASAVTAHVCYYHRIGSIVSVVGAIEVDPTSAGIYTDVSITLPIASNFGATDDGWGTATGNIVAGTTGMVTARADDTLQLSFIAPGTANQFMTFSAMYRII